MSPSVTLITIGPHPGTLTTLLAFPGVQAIVSLPVSSREFSVALKTHSCRRSKFECIGRCLQKKEMTPPWGLLFCSLCASSDGVRSPQPSDVTDGKMGSGTVQRENQDSKLGPSNSRPQCLVPCVFMEHHLYQGWQRDFISPVSSD